MRLLGCLFPLARGGLPGVPGLSPVRAPWDPPEESQEVFGVVCSPRGNVCLQIGTGFKDEDLEQHHNFLKVGNLNSCLVLILSLRLNPPGLVGAQPICSPTLTLINHFHFHFHGFSQSSSEELTAASERDVSSAPVHLECSLKALARRSLQACCPFLESALNFLPPL